MEAIYEIAPFIISSKLILNYNLDKISDYLPKVLYV